MKMVENRQIATTIPSNYKQSMSRCGKEELGHCTCRIWNDCKLNKS